MKKLLALLLAVLMMFALVACGGADNDDDKPSSKPVIVDDGDEDGEEKEKPVLSEDDEFVICIKKGSLMEIASIKDIKGLKVGYVEDIAEKIALYYDAEPIYFGGENDAFSALIGGQVDCVIVKKMAGEQYQNEKEMATIVIDPVVIE